MVDGWQAVPKYHCRLYVSSCMHRAASNDSLCKAPLYNSKYGYSTLFLANLECYS